VKRSSLISFLSFALLFSAAANLSFHPAQHHSVQRTTVTAQTGGDPEPINPPGSGGN
jgi:hypothetical protein